MGDKEAQKEFLQIINTSSNVNWGCNRWEEIYRNFKANSYFKDEYDVGLSPFDGTKREMYRRLSNLLFYSFTWESTEEGEDYWMSIYRDLSEGREPGAKVVEKTYEEFLI